MTLRRANRKDFFGPPGRARRDPLKKGDHMYQHPNVKYPAHLLPEQIVEHKDLPGVPLTVVSGPEQGISGERYTVKKPGGEVARVLRKNLIL